MRAYIIRRLLLLVPTIFLVTLIVFFSVRFIPGSVIDLMMSEAQDVGMGVSIEVTAENIKHALGLDVPVHVQYGRWLGVLPYPDTGFSGVFQGSLGWSLWSGQPVLEDLLAKLPVSIELGIFAILIALTIALPIGVYSAIRQDTGGDYTGRTIAILFISVPSFWLGTLVTVYPSIWWNWSPPVEYIPLVENPLGNLAQFVLPAVILGMFTSGTTMRMTRTMMLEVLRQDYIRTAWSKGLSERTIILRHAMKNAFIPVVTLVGLMLPVLVGGSVVMEQIFNLPGVGRFLLDALSDRDYPIISGINVALGLAVLVINLGIDLTYGYLDPRVVYK